MFKDARLKRIYGQTLWPYASGNLGNDATKTNRTTLQAQRSANKGSNMIQDASLWMEYDGILDADG